MAEYLLDRQERPFACCTEPVTDLSHDASELLFAYGDPRASSFFAPPSHSLAEDAGPDRLLFAVYSEPAVFAPLETVAQTDTATYKHAMRVGSCAARTALMLGLDIQEAKIAVRAALLHDHGKVHPDVQAAIHSPATVQSDPSLYDTIQQHPWHGVRLLAPYCHSRNVLQVVGNHHSLQTERPAYGIFEGMHNLAEPDGNCPDTQRLLEIVAASDLCDAIWTAPRVKERTYQANTHESYGDVEWLTAVLASLQASDEVLQATFDYATEAAFE